MPEDVKKLKLATEAYLKEKGFEINPNLPVIETLAEVSPRSASDVGRRAFAMSNLTGIGYKANRRKIRKQLKQYDLWEFVTPRERKDLSSLRVTEKSRIHYQWLCECIQGLAWCLGKDDMDHFSRCNINLADIIPPKTDPESFINTLRLRPLSEIQQQADLLYRLNWAAKFKERHENVKNVNFNVIAERRRAIDWVYGIEENWDDISLDT